MSEKELKIMGWTYYDLQRNRITLEQAKAEHVREATGYSDKIARIIMHEWHEKAWYAIIGFYHTAEDVKPYETFLRTDMIDASPASFGYKDMTEEVGPYIDTPPSASMKRAILKYIPFPVGFAIEFRKRMGIPYMTHEQTALSI